MVEVTLWGALGQLAGGKSKVEVEAKDIRELFRKLAEQYPGFEPWIDRGIAVAIDGTIYRDTWSKELPKGAEIFLMPRLAGGSVGAARCHRRAGLSRGLDKRLGDNCLPVPPKPAVELLQLSCRLWVIP